MATELEKIEKQIAKLQKQAEAVKAKEVGEVVERIKEAIARYGLTSADLFGAGRRASRKKASTTAKRGAARKTASAVKYRDEAGNSWTGRGKRPNWFKAALEAGKSAEDLLAK